MSVWERLVRWYNNQDMIDYWSDCWWQEHKDVLEEQKKVADLAALLTEAYSRNIDLSVLLENAPMLDVITEYDSVQQRNRLSHIQTAFIYVHPKTFEKHIRPYGDVDSTGKFSIAGSPTQYIATSLMPMGRMLLSPRQLLRQKSNG